MPFGMPQGLCRSIKEYYREPIKLARLWVHETERVFRCAPTHPHAHPPTPPARTLALAFPSNRPLRPRPAS
jgi:hypothetical protein